jgi:threonine synthase
MKKPSKNSIAIQASFTRIMKYHSTRDSSLVSFEDAVMRGLAPDGGLFIPETIPTITEEHLVTWENLKFPLLAHRIFRLFIDSKEIGDDDLLAICNTSFKNFTHEDIVPLQTISRTLRVRYI